MVPVTTRKPLPSAPRVGSRKSFVDIIGRLMENRRGTASGSIPGPSSTIAYPLFGNVSIFTLPPLSSPLSTASLTIRRRNRLFGTPARC